MSFSIRKFYLNKEDGSQYRICIIDNIDDFSIDASNSLLKLIEEPPENSLFIIINHNKLSSNYNDGKKKTLFLILQILR